ncbi:mitochondrial pyruvate carrier 2-like [Oppia nitens]|uniref:mitochondrial pyruvate carrier 2-like n=1 Tax=Oppia nitens TaxID=1686743 RepID=UPI0023DA2B24|nr:mitochondrial pyruvate carrier 2-like [Oppia nitens]XP_054163153.1 mitochondrial pyruvate carrier 2-like [Oppia nitens]
MSVIYRSLVTACDRFVPTAMRPLWEHPAGPKTIFFWAPAMKWGLVIASISDIQRPVDKLSATQTSALAATGLIWSRYSLVITPKNWALFSVNVFVAITNCYQLSRIYNYNRKIKQ